MTEKSFIERFLSFNFQEQFQPSFTVSKTNIIGAQAENCFILVTSSPRRIASDASALMFCFSFGGVIIVWRFYFLQSADTHEFITNFHCLGQWHIDFNKNSKKKSKKLKFISLKIHLSVMLHQDVFLPCYLWLFQEASKPGWLLKPEISIAEESMICCESFQPSIDGKRLKCSGEESSLFF